MNEKKFVRYEDFGAVGDGVTNDFAAIYAAHNYANEHGIPVRAADGKTYYISDTRIDGEIRYISVKTDVDFGEANFIIDDSGYSSFDGTRIAQTNIFKIQSDYPEEVITDESVLSRLAGIGKGTKKLDLALGYPAMVIIYDSENLVYRRSGASFKDSSQQAGHVQKELLVIDAEGNIDESTPFIFEYAKVTKLEIIRLDVKPITVKGGTFTTIASRVHCVRFDENGKKIKSAYVSRGMEVNRSYTTVKNVKHYVENEVTTEEQANGLLGPHYRGFFRGLRANEITFEDCILTGRRYYRVSGTYDFGADTVNKIILKNCTQSNFIMKDEEGRDVYSMSISPLTNTRYCWGIGGTNFCKNMEYIGCTLSRLDAHMGLTNGKIVDSKINFIALTGGGDFLVENTDWYAVGEGITNNAFLYLRGDYGCTWDGDITIRNVKATPVDEDFYLFNHSYLNFYYGYDCHVPSIELDGFELVGRPDGSVIHFMSDEKSLGKEPNIHKPVVLNTPVVDEESGAKDYTNYNPIVPPKYIRVKNNKHGYVYKITDSDFYADTELVGITKE